MQNSSHIRVKVWRGDAAGGDFAEFRCALCGAADQAGAFLEIINTQWRAKARGS